MTDKSRKHPQRRLGGIAGHVPPEQPVIFAGIRSKWHRIAASAVPAAAYQAYCNASAWARGREAGAAMNPLRYLLRSIAFSALRGWRTGPRYAGTLAGRALGGWLASWPLGRRE